MHRRPQQRELIWTKISVVLRLRYPVVGYGKKMSFSNPEKCLEQHTYADCYYPLALSRTWALEMLKR